MGYELGEIKEAIIKSHVNADRIDEKQSNEIWHNIVAKYTNARDSYAWLWESFLDCYSVQGADSWEWIPFYLQHRPCYFIVNDVEMVGEYGRKIVYYFKDGNSIVDMYNETGQSIEFYVTDEELSFLLSYNHHDYLSACGEAKKWLIDFSSGDKNGG
mgnify:CR=1 FL=1